MSTVEVKRWRRYGHDRIFVSDGAVRLGWHDLLTGATRVDVVERDADVRRAVADWLASNPRHDGPVGVVAPVESADAERVDERVDEDEEDLAGRIAGAMAREQATALRQAAPVRTFVARILGLRTDERAWRIGAEGEKRVSVRLEALHRKDPRWRILHAIPVGLRGSDIDHLVIGPGGVFTLNSKHHPGANVWVARDTVMVNGRRLPYVRNSRHEAARAGRLLGAQVGRPVSVMGLVVLVGAEELAIKQEPEDVHVLSRGRLLRWLRRRPEVLDAAAIETIYEAARRPGTWLPSSRATGTRDEER